jgi:hypothetical protein
VRIDAAVLDPTARRWDRSRVSGSSDDVPERRRGAVRPPPSLVPDDAPASIDVPRMEPPPPSLEAMVQSVEPLRKRPEPRAAWLVWLLVALVAAAVTAYLTR